MAAIFVSGFDFGTDGPEIEKHFGPVGAIKEVHFQSKGSAVITYEEEASAAKALAELHETTMEGQSRYVAIKLDARPEGKGKSRGSGEGKGPGVYASGFDTTVTDEETLRKHFGAVGEIKDLYFQSKGSAVITYDDEETANKAVEKLHESTMPGQTRYVSVRLNNENREGKGKGKGKDKGKGQGSGKSSGKGGGGGKGNKVYASGFSYDTDENTCWAHFEKVGTIVDLYFQSKGGAVITYKDARAAERAVSELDGSYLKGQERYVSVKLDDRGPGDSKGKRDGKGKGKSYGKR